MATTVLRWGAPKVAMTTWATTRGAPKGGVDDDGAPGCTKDRRGEERRDGAMKR